MEKALVRIIFDHIFICHPKNIIRLLECTKMFKSHFAGGVSEQGDMPKGSFQRMVLESSTSFSMAGFVKKRSNV